jgi:hypothetical protein
MESGAMIKKKKKKTWKVMVSCCLINEEVSGSISVFWGNMLVGNKH